MQITVKKLKQIIKEEVDLFNEQGAKVAKPSSVDESLIENAIKAIETGNPQAALRLLKSAVDNTRNV